MNKIEIISHLASSHSTFWATAIHLPKNNTTIEGKWSVAQHIAHITLALFQLNKWFDRKLNSFPLCPSPPVKNANANNRPFSIRSRAR